MIQKLIAKLRPPRPVEWLDMPFPIRRDTLAHVRVPRDLTTKEAERLVAFVQSLVRPEPVEFDIDEIWRGLESEAAEERT